MDNAKLGLWTPNDIPTALHRYDGTRYYQSLPPEVQFVHSVAKILAKRNAKDKAALCSAPSLYILSPAPEGIALKSQPAFSYGGVEVSGKIWFGAPAMNRSNGVQIPDGADTDALFTFVSQTLKSGSRPAVYFDGSANDEVFRFYPGGVDDPDNCEDITFCGAQINETTLKSLLDRIHERSLMTPTASPSSGDLWKDGRKCYPVEQAERAIQRTLYDALAATLGNVRVKYEETGVFGRYDLALIEQDPLDPSKSTNHAILELKIVKAFTSTGNPVSDTANKKAVLKGITQAFAYRKEHGSRISALCCYDMRSNPTLHKHFDCGCKAATKLEVKLWAWPLFSTTEASRDRLAEDHLMGVP